MNRLSTATVTRQAVRPQDAASLILLRHESSEPEVLMGQRQSKIAFMPGAYVFPGGKVDREDGRVHAVSSLETSMIKHMAVAGNAIRARALAMAAVRELFEESGLILGRAGDVGSVVSPSWQALKKAHLAPDLERLVYIARAITPTFYPIRFHARFFMADAACVTGALSGSGELVDLHWVPLSRASDLPIAEVTAFVLGEVRRLLNTSAKEHNRKAMFTYRRNGPYARYS